MISVKKLVLEMGRPDFAEKAGDFLSPARKVKNSSPEHNFQKDVVAYLHLNKWITIDCDIMDGLKYLGRDNKKRLAFINHHKTMGYTKGQPDLIAFRDRAVIFLELKAGKNKQSEEQINFQYNLERAGFYYFVCRDLKELETWIQKNNL